MTPKARQLILDSLAARLRELEVLKTIPQSIDAGIFIDTEIQSINAFIALAESNTIFNEKTVL